MNEKHLKNALDCARAALVYMKNKDETDDIILLQSAINIIDHAIELNYSCHPEGCDHCKGNCE